MECRKPFIAGNWKMNTDAAVAVALADGLAKALAGVNDSRCRRVPAVCVSAGGGQGAEAARRSRLGAQDVYFEDNGAFTGEISCAMLKDVGCSYVIIGHSERRHVIGETDELINKKVAAAIAGGLLADLLRRRTAGGARGEQDRSRRHRQVKKGLAGVAADQMQAVTIAYEPVWAIGTGRTATPQQARKCTR